MTNQTRRKRIVGAGLAAVTPVSFAQEKYPSRPVTVIVPQAPGGANDAIARIVAAKLGELMGQQFNIENRAGAGGNIGTVAAAKAKGLRCVVLSGKDGGQMAGQADVEIRVPHFGYADRIQEVHIKVIHLLIQLIELEMAR